MLYKKLLLLLVAMLMVTLAMGCSSDDEESNINGSGDNQTTLPTQPAAAESIDDAPIDALVGSGNTYCAMAATYISMAKGYSSFFTPPSGAAKEYPASFAADTTITYTWSDGSITIVMTFEETSTNYYWSVVFNGTDGEEVYDNFIFAEAQQNKTGTDGWMKAYDLSDGLIFDWVWTEDATGKFTMTISGYESGVITTEVEIVLNADGSGYIEFTENDILKLRVTWNATATSGTYYYFDGSQTLEGTWVYTG
ncbi:MAG: hypothetical protein U9R56_05225 [candidate division Zixibacteria bacterium]|nr:hypothetical protein [candidate division Zixibacteria bacterium]